MYIKQLSHTSYGKNTWGIMCCIAHSGPNSSAKRLTLLAAASRIEYTYNHNQYSSSQYDTFNVNIKNLVALQTLSFSHCIQRAPSLSSKKPTPN
jgi:hypothetical protein